MPSLGPFSALLLLTATTTLPAGALSPPAAPAPTAGPEPRIAVSPQTTPGSPSSVYAILAPGSYYLTGNLAGESGKSGLFIDADDVTLDLNGFEIIGTAGATDAIAISAFRGLRIHGGTIRSWPGAGVTGTALSDSTIEDLFIANCGGAAIAVQADCRIVDCTVRQCGNGIVAADSAQVRGCTLQQLQTGGITVGPASLVSSCVVNAVSGGTGIVAGSRSIIVDCSVAQCIDGISAGQNGLVRGCTTAGNTGTGIASAYARIENCVSSGNSTGISLGEGGVASGCRVYGCALDGIRADIGCAILDNHLMQNGFGGTPGAAIHLLSQRTRVEGNTISDNYHGIRADNAFNIIVRNTLTNNTDNLGQVTGGNRVGTLTSDPNTAGPWANLN